MLIKTVQEIVEKAFLRDRTFATSSTDKDRIHFFETDNTKDVKWIKLTTKEENALIDAIYYFTVLATHEGEIAGLSKKDKNYKPLKDVYNGLMNK